MPTSYNRYINLFIDGKQVENSVKGINAALSKIRNEQRLMTIGSQEYIAAANKIKSLKGMLDEHNKAISNVSKSWSLRSLADGVNRYFALITTFMASFAGLALTVKSTVKAYAEFEDKLADVRKTTGLTKDQVNALNESLKKIDTRTAQMELLDLARVAGKLGLSDQSEILGFVRAADKIAVALTEDLGGNIEESVNELGKLVDIFKLKDQFGMEQSLIKVGSAINSLGAAGTANEGYLVEFAKRVAGIAPSANISIQNILGLGTTLDELGQTAEVAGTVYNSVISAMFKDTPTYAKMARMSVKQFTDLLNTDANEAFIKVMEGAKGSGNGFSEMAQNLGKLGLDGARSTSVLAVLANNIDKLREKQSYSNQEFEKGTSLQKEFDIKNTTAQATLDKAKKGFDDLARKLGEQLTPAYTSVISKSSLLLKLIGLTVGFLYTYSGTLITLISTIAAYALAVKVAAYWDNIHYGYLVAKSAVIKSAQAIWGVLTGRITLATAAQNAWNLAQKLNPIGAVIAILVAAGSALYLYTRRLSAAEIAQKALNEINAKATQSISDEKVEMELLLRVAQNDKLSKDMRLDAIEKLNKISPEYLGGLTLETINTENATIATNNYVDALRKKAEVEAITENIKSANSEISRLQAGDGGDATFWQKAWNFAKYGKTPVMLAQANANTKTENAKARIKELTIQLGVYQTELDNKISAIDTGKKAPNIPGGGIDSPNALNNLDKSNKANAGTGAGSAENPVSDVLALAHKQRILDLTARYANEEDLQKEFHARMLAEELAYLQAQLSIEKNEGKKLDLQTEIINKTKAYTDALKEATPEMMKNSGERKGLSNTMLNEVSALNITLKSLKKAGNEYDDFAKKVKSQVDIIQQMTGIVSDGLYEMISGTEDAFQSFAKNMLIFALEQLKAQAQIAYAGIFIQYLASPDSLATLGASAVIKSAIMYGLIESVFAVAEGAVNSAFGGSKKGNYDTGGYTGDGGVYEPAGIVHRGEYVIPQWLVKNPALQPMIGMTEFLRRNKGLSGMQLNPLVQSGITAGGGYAAGGPISGIASGMQAPSFTIGSDPELKAINRALAEELRYLRENGIKAKVAGYGGEGSVADALTKIANLAKSVGLK